MINKCQKDPTCGISLKRGMFMDNSESRMVVQGLVFIFPGTLNIFSPGASNKT